MSAQDLEQRAREYQHVLDMLGVATHEEAGAEIGRLHAAALRQQPAPVDLEQFREAVRAVDDFIFHRDRCGFPHQICDCGMKEARDRLLSIIELCPCGEATCAESWEPGCGLGESVEHAVPAEREPPRGDELRAILARQPAPVVDEAMRKDAERYRWMRNPTSDVGLVIDKVTGEVPYHEGTHTGGYATYEYRAGDELDSAIDAALARAQGVQS